MKYSNLLVDKVCSDDDAKSNTRFSLFIKLKNEKSNTVIVILKNPSKANEHQSDYTVNRVIKYIYNSNVLDNVGAIVIVNLIPFYETDSKKLNSIKRESEEMDINVKKINDLTSKYENVIIAWGNHPKSNQKVEYNSLSKEILEILKGKENIKIYQVGSLSKLNNPKHGQVWKDADELKLWF